MANTVTKANPKPHLREKNKRGLTDLWLRRLDAKKELAKLNIDRRREHRRLRRPNVEFKEISQFHIWDEGCDGLSVLVSAGGTKTFRATFKLGKTWITHTLGRFDEMVADPDPDHEDVLLSEARRLTKSFRAKAKAGIDPRTPNAQPQATAPADKPTLGAVIDLFVEHYAKPRQRTWDQTQRVLKNNCATLLDQKMADLDHAAIRTLLRGFIQDGHPYKAAITKRWLAKLWRWAYNEDYVAVPLIKGLDNIETEKRVRDRVYSDAEVKAIWKAADQLDPQSGGFIKLLVLLAPRKTALASARAADFDSVSSPTLWTTPFELTKSRKNAAKKRVYLTPLPPLAKRIVKGLLKDVQDRVFANLPVHETAAGRPTFYGIKLRDDLIEKGAPKDFAYHTMRHTLATWLQNKKYSEDQIGVVLNHSGSGSVTAGYSHGSPTELKLELLTAWAEHVQSLVGTKGAALLR